jgi:hypothetical protein
VKPDFFTGKQNSITTAHFAEESTQLCGFIPSYVELNDFCYKSVPVLCARILVSPALGRAVLDDQRQCFGVDVKQVAVDVYLLRCSLPFAEKTCVALER